MGQPESLSRHPRIRRDGWTAERQLRFLDALARTRSVSRAAAFAGMSRESAYRLRARRDGALFAAAWDRAMKGHISVNFIPTHPGVRSHSLEPATRSTS